MINKQYYLMFMFYIFHSFSYSQVSVYKKKDCKTSLDIRDKLIVTGISKNKLKMLYKEANERYLCSKTCIRLKNKPGCYYNCELGNTLLLNGNEYSFLKEICKGNQCNQIQYLPINLKSIWFISVAGNICIQSLYIPFFDNSTKYIKIDFSSKFLSTYFDYMIDEKNDCAILYDEIIKI